ncbi:MAG TPA: energy transducer TonB [Stellaceae bacterium]|nr:energy transducer TonB [Stellaceae bacterium]
MGLRRGPIALLFWLVAGPAAAASDAGTAGLDPGAGSVVNGVYLNPYFGLRYPLPAGWSPGPQPPAPSYSGYYVLATPSPPKGAEGTILAAAQDTFFAAPPVADARAMAEDLAKSAATGGAKPILSDTVIAGRRFTRLDLAGSPLSRAVLATDIRCHVVIFTFAAAKPEQLQRLVATLDGLQFSGGGAPACRKGYVSAQTTRHRVEPAPAPPYFVELPARLLIDAAGRVAQVHVIRGSPAQRQNIADALAQWRFAPYVADGRPASIETGLTFRFAPAGR